MDRWVSDMQTHLSIKQIRSSKSRCDSAPFLSDMAPVGAEETERRALSASKRR